MGIAIRLATVASFTLALAACGSPGASSDTGGSGESAAAAAPAPAADGKPAAFAQCMACHSTEKGKNGIGPSLAGVYGTKSGEVAGYAFSEAMMKASLTWDDATLDKWIESPMKLVPGTRMTFAGMSDPAQRAAIIAYLKTLK